MAKSNHTDRVSVKPACSTDPFDEGMMRLHCAEQLAAYLSICEDPSDGEPEAARSIAANVASAITVLISDAETLLTQASAESGGKRA